MGFLMLSPTFPAQLEKIYRRNFDRNPKLKMIVRSKQFRNLVIRFYNISCYVFHFHGRIH